jgi:hypothetical protein
VSHTRRSGRTPTPRQWRRKRCARPRRWAWEVTIARRMGVRRSSWLRCGTCRAGREVEACPRGRRSRYSRACLLGIEVREIPGLSRHHQKWARIRRAKKFTHVHENAAPSKGGFYPNLAKVGKAISWINQTGLRRVIHPGFSGRALPGPARSGEQPWSAILRRMATGRGTRWRQTPR